MDWDDVRVFLEAARLRTHAAAGRRLGMDPTTVGRRVARLEESLGVSLLERTPSGTVLAPAGEAVLVEAMQIEESILRLTEAAERDRSELSGCLRVAMAEPLYRFCLADAVSRFGHRHPALLVDLLFGSARANLLEREADLAIRPGPRPNQRQIIARKLGEIRLGIYASHAYIDQHGRPGRGDLSGHHTVVFDPQLADLPLAPPEHEFVDGARVVARVNTMNALGTAGRSGMGLIAAPHFLGDALAGTGPDDLVRLRSNIRAVDLWLLVHPDLRRTAKVQAFVAMLDEELPALRTKLAGA